MELKMESNQKELTVFLRGELDHHAAGRLREQIDSAVSGQNEQTLILDFDGIQFMDSSGVGLLMGRYKLMRGRGGALRVRGVQPRLMGMLRMAGLEKLGIFEEDTHESNQ